MVVNKRIKNEIFADMYVRYKFILSQKFGSHIKFDKEKLTIETNYIEGPLKDLTTNWKFESIESKKSKIIFNVNFEFKNFIHQKIAETFYPLIENKMIDSFKERAKNTLEKFESSKVKIVFENIIQKKEKNYNSIVGNFSVQSVGGQKENLAPELRVYNQPNIATSEADIKTTLISDKFIVMNIVQNQEYFNIRYQVKPFMIWIWLSVLLISVGGLLSLIKKNHEK